MTKIAPSTAVNEYYLARIAASKANDRLKSRDGASEETGIDHNRLKRIEMGTLTPYSEEIVLMADAYNAPELLNHYCTHSCPIGQRILPYAEVNRLDRMTINIVAAEKSITGIGSMMLDIAEDGIVTPDEIPRLMTISQALWKVMKASIEMHTWLEKYIKKGANA